MYGLLGDVLMRTPVLRELRVLYPEGAIVALVDPIGKEALRLTNLIDDLIVLDRNKRVLTLYFWHKVIHLLKVRHAQFDLLIDLYSGQSSRQLVKFSGARYQIFSEFGKVRTNFAYSLEGKADLFSFENPHHLGNASLRVFSAITAAAINCCTRPALDIDRLLTRLMKRNEKLGTSRGCFFLVSLGAGDPKKIPDIVTIARVCELVFKTKGYTPRVIKNPGNEILQETLVDELQKRAVPVQPLELLGLEDIACEMLASRFLITPDSGLFHLAIGLGVRVLSFFTYTNPELVRPNAKNCLMLFEPDFGSAHTTTTLPFGKGTPAPEKVLEATTVFLSSIEE